MTSRTRKEGKRRKIEIRNTIIETVAKRIKDKKQDRKNI